MLKRFIQALAWGFALGIVQTTFVIMTNHGLHLEDWREHLTAVVAGGLAGTLLVLKTPPKG